MIKPNFNEERSSFIPHKILWGFTLIFITLILTPSISHPYLEQKEIPLIPSDGLATDNIGHSVALTADGRFALVGAPGHNTIGANSGAVYMFEQDGTVWGKNELWATGAADGVIDDEYGFSVALGAVGEYALVGAPYHDHMLLDQSSDAAGAAYILQNNTGGAWQTVSELWGYSSSGDLFGWSVALSSDENTALVGAPGADVGGVKSGSAYLFKEGGPVPWSFQATLIPESPSLDGLFGSAVALSGDGKTVLIGAPGEGAAYIFTEGATGGWDQQPKFVPSDGNPSTFGWSVALSADGCTALVGAPSNSGGGAIFVYQFSESDGFWIEIQKLVSSDLGSSDQFGWSVAITENGTTTLVGAPSNNGVGAVYWFKTNGFYWQEHVKLTASDKEVDDRFGSSVALNGNGTIALVGAPNQDKSYVYIWQSVDPTPMEVSLSGAFDYRVNEDISIQIAALITDSQTHAPISGVDVTINIYGPNGSLVFNDAMEEKIPTPGVYLWESPTTLNNIGLPIGVYLVYVAASTTKYLPTVAMMELHIIDAETTTIPPLNTTTTTIVPSTTTTELTTTPTTTTTTSTTTTASLVSKTTWITYTTLITITYTKGTAEFATLAIFAGFIGIIFLKRRNRK